MNNIPEVKVGIVAVSRDCFPESLSVNRREALVKAYTDKYGAADIYECPICIVESEIHMVQALEDVKTGDLRDTACKTFRGTEDVCRSSGGDTGQPDPGTW